MQGRPTDTAPVADPVLLSLVSKARELLALAETIPGATVTLTAQGRSARLEIALEDEAPASCSPGLVLPFVRPSKGSRGGRPGNPNSKAAAYTRRYREKRAREKREVGQ